MDADGITIILLLLRRKNILAMFRKDDNDVLPLSLI